MLTDATTHKYETETDSSPGTAPSPNNAQCGWRLWVKRALDMTVASGMLATSWPIFVSAAILIKKQMGSPVFFRQTRPGKGGVPFQALKFRTMKDAYDAQGQPLPDSERLTDLGRFLRRTSIDELPQLFNVLRGELSMVGPRPLLMRYLERYDSDQLRRHDVLPGLTGWAQVNGRNTTAWQQRFAQDVWYVDNWSLLLDAKIIAMTAWKVVKREGINQQGHETMTEFLGNTGDITPADV